MPEETSIPIKKDTRDRLGIFCGKKPTGKGDMSYNVGINLLLDFYDEHKYPVDKANKEKKEGVEAIIEPEDLGGE